MGNETVFDDYGKLDRLLEGLVSEAIGAKGITYAQAAKEVAAQAPALCALRDALRLAVARPAPAVCCSGSNLLPPYFGSADLRRLFGVSQKTLSGWIGKGAMKVAHVDYFVALDEVGSSSSSTVPSTAWQTFTRNSGGA